MMKHFLRGFTTIEILGALAIGTMMLLGLSTMIDTALEDTKGQQASLYQEQVAKAAAKFIAANYATYAVAGNVTATAAITLSDLVSQNFLSSGFQAVNSYGQSPCILVRAIDTGRKDASNNPMYALSALVVTEQTLGASAIPDRLIAVVAGNAGLGGGAIALNGPSAGIAVGAFGSWRLDNASPTPSLADFQTQKCNASAPAPSFFGGSLVTQLLYDGSGQLSTDFLYRHKVNGRDELNTMHTALLFNTTPSSSNNALVTEGQACNAAGVAVENDPTLDTTGTLLYCDISDPVVANRKWTRMTNWKRPVSITDISQMDALAGNTEGDIRVFHMTTAPAWSRAFVYHGGAWTALAVDQNNDLTVPRNMNAGGDIAIAGNTVIGGNANVTGDLRVVNGKVTIENGDVAIDKGELDVTLGGIENEANWMTTGSITIQDVFTVGAACNIFAGYSKSGYPTYQWPEGTLTVEQATNKLLLCQYGTHTFQYAN